MHSICIVKTARRAIKPASRSGEFAECLRPEFPDLYFAVSGGFEARSHLLLSPFQRQAGSTGVGCGPTL
jgi:hypothetical protein